MNNNTNLLSRIAIYPNYAYGKPCLKRHGVWVSSILADLADGRNIKDILEKYPCLEQEDILACFAYAAEMTQDITEVVGKIKMIQEGTVLDEEPILE